VVYILAERLTAQGYLTNADGAPAKSASRKGGR
jgi:hypothetical protein